MGLRRHLFLRYDLWKAGETERYVRDLVIAFARYPQLPRMMNRQAIIDTIAVGCRHGQCVLRATRPDKTTRTSWRRVCDDNELKDVRLEVVLPEPASLTEIDPTLLASGNLPELWLKPDLTVADFHAYFAGGKNVKIKKEGYDDPVTIPKAEPAVVDATVAATIKEGKLWLTIGTASILTEDLPVGLLTAQAVLQAPPQPIPAADVTPTALPEAWKGPITTAQAIATVLSQKAGKPLPWVTVRDAIDGTFRARMLERTIDSAPWPSDSAGCGSVKLKLPPTPQPQPQAQPKPAGVYIAESDMRPSEIQDLADHLGDIQKAAVGLELKFRIRVEVGGKNKPTPEMVNTINEKLKEVAGGWCCNRLQRLAPD